MIFPALGNEVVGSDAGGREKRARQKDVQLVPQDSTTVRDPPGQGAAGDARMIRKQRAATEDLKLRAANILASPQTLMQLRASVQRAARRCAHRS
jgi:hypothetical protein